MTSIIDYEIYPEEELITASVMGALTVDSFLSAVIKLRADARFKPTFKVVWDIRAAETTSGWDEVQQAVNGLAAIPGRQRSKLALLVDTPRNTAVAAIFEQLASHLYQSKTFSTVEAAGDWLGKNLPAYLPGSRVATLCDYRDKRCNGLNGA